MKRITKITIQLLAAYLGCSAMVPLYSCQKELHFDETKEKDYDIAIHFKAVVDTADLQFGQTYTNFFDEPYKVKSFKFYITRIDFINTDSGKTYHATNDYYLIDFADSASTTIHLLAPPYKYNRIALMLGVDSAHNVSGAQTGALDPAKGMFWTWNSGYVMAKLEGSSPLSNQPGNVIEYHIGGFRDSVNAARNVNLLFPFAQQLQTTIGKVSNMTITANTNAWFYNPHEIHIAEIPVCTTPGAMAKSISENYSKMLTVTDIVNP